MQEIRKPLPTTSSPWRRFKRKGGRYSKEQRTVAPSRLGQARQSGMRLADVARELGIDPNTLRKWEDAANTTATVPLKPVRVVDRGGTRAIERSGH